MDSVYCERNESMKVNYTIKGLPPLERKLQQISLVKWGAVANKNLTQIFNRAGRKPGTPRKTGELIRARRIQLGTDIGGKWKGSMGYAKDYAPHVEYGHRTVKGGYVPGQRYLKRNVEIQQKTYRKDLIEALRNA